ncbi:MAG: FtsX-like permease family protein [Chlorobi bacterium]|nr:FtsX-like permease family protein [Chlorobiota bacterium]
MLNIIGLSLGIAVFVFIYLYVQSEFRYDRHWKDYDKIYRITTEYNLNDQSEFVALTPFLLADRIEKNLAGVDNATKIFFSDPSDVNDMSTLIYNDEVFEVPDITLGDSNVFRIFDFDFVEGDYFSSLSKANSIVISTEVSKMIFGDEKALGKKLKTHIREYTITGVFEKKSRPSHLFFDAIVSINSLPEEDTKIIGSDWFWMSCYTYVKLKSGRQKKDFQFELNEYTNDQIRKYVEQEELSIKGYSNFSLEEIYDVHFNTSLLYDNPENIDKLYLFVFAIIAGFILLTASINYVNLATARSLKRAKEIGVFKVLGARKRQLSLQYISESLILTTLAFILALSLVELLMPQFNILVGKDLTLIGSLFSKDGIVFGLLLVIMILVLSVISGIFPAFVLSYLQPANVLKGNKLFISKEGKARFTTAGLRKLLVTIQYIVAIGMIISTIIMYEQMMFLKKQDLGFDSRNVMVINMPQDTSFSERAHEFIDKLADNDSIEMLSVAGNLPGYTSGRMMYYTSDSTNIQSLNFFIVGSNFFKLLGIPLLEGGSFSEDEGHAKERKYIVNRAAADTLGDDKIIGSILHSTTGSSGKIIGVVGNFRFSSLYKGVEPLVIMFSDKRARYVLLKIRENSRATVIAHITKVWNKYNSAQYLHYTFLDQKLESLYKGDYKMLSLFTYFSLFVIFISSLGLYGLSSFLIEQRTKELGIRKVLGGSANNILMLLARDYLKLVALAGIIASPIVYVLLGKWLDMFALSIKMRFWEFAAGILLVMLIAFITVFIRARKVMHEKPSKSLYFE